MLSPKLKNGSSLTPPTGTSSTTFVGVSIEDMSSGATTNSSSGTMSVISASSKLSPNISPK